MGHAHRVRSDGTSAGSRQHMRLGVNDNPFEPDLLLGVQWAALNRSTATSPERKLMLAVLESVVNDLETAREAGDTEHAARLREPALAWLASADREWPMSFLNVCDALGLEPDYIRRGARKLAAQPKGTVVDLAKRRHVVSTDARRVMGV